MKFMVDSNIFKDRKCLEKLMQYKGNIGISAIVELEQRFYYILKNKVNLWTRICEELGIKVIQITKIDAQIAAQYAQNFIRHPKGAAYFFRDCLIAANATRNSSILITNNKRDFDYLSKETVFTSSEFLESYS
ncbi:MAG: type II toxin-antitoxin system VapC family toxin [Candidatus Kariarchaeaceae archaeon]|jgi:predicted nucleic acid-binding protein